MALKNNYSSLVNYSEKTRGDRLVKDKPRMTFIARKSQTFKL